jgi:hypothetical protein
MKNIINIMFLVAILMVTTLVSSPLNTNATSEEVFDLENTYELCTDRLDNNENTLIDRSEPDCAPFYVEEEATSTPPVEEEVVKKNRSGSRRSGGGSSVPSTGSVLGAFDSNSCSEHITSYIKFGQANNSADVSRLQTFLNEFLKTNLVVSGEYDQATFDAVKKLQDTYSNEILKPWVDAGLMKSAVSTGYVYKTTRWFINNIKCSGIPFPLLP